MKSKSRAQALEKAFRQHERAIQSALSLYHAARASEVVTLRNGVQIVIKHGSQGYQVIGLAS